MFLYINCSVDLCGKASMLIKTVVRTERDNGVLQEFVPTRKTDPGSFPFVLFFCVSSTGFVHCTHFLLLNKNINRHSDFNSGLVSNDTSLTMFSILQLYKFLSIDINENLITPPVPSFEIHLPPFYNWVKCVTFYKPS